MRSSARVLFSLWLLAACGGNSSSKSPAGMDGASDANITGSRGMVPVSEAPDAAVADGSGPDLSSDAPPQALCVNAAPCSTGDLIMKADYWCRSHNDPAFDRDVSPLCANGRVTDPYYLGLPCPFDVAVAHTPGWKGPCLDCIDGVIITNSGTSTSAAWRTTPFARYCCDGNSVRKLACSAP
jgi:hypothetical protein